MASENSYEIHQNDTKVHVESDPVNTSCSSSSYSSSSSSSSSSRSSIDEAPFDIDKADLDSSTEANKSDLDVVPPAPQPSPAVSPTKTSPPQIPRPSGGYDPNRLPPAMFAVKPSSAMEWSVASNESLFSIHVGNSSFSKDQYSNDLEKLDELEETLESDGHNVETKKAISDKEDSDIDVVAENVEKEEEIKEITMLLALEEAKGSSALLRVSDETHESDHSNQSFQFPRLADHYDRHVTSTLEKTKEKNKPEMQVPEKQQFQQDEKSREINAPLMKVTESRSSWFSCFCCCWIFR